MKKLVIFRHGHDHGTRESLSPSGRERVRETAEKLSPHFDGSSLLILSSTALRAVETAEIIAERFCASFESHDVLWSGGGGKCRGSFEDFAKVLEIINGHEKQADVVVLVTHYEYVEAFPAFFGRKCLDAKLPVVDAIPKGTALLINCETKEMVHIK